MCPKSKKGALWRDAYLD
uniref:Uncharacterized protein n=1 Tax=Rhizophora mucronata TaxID=61149 RepID=A0A2P2Q8L6_RHIMU